MRTRETKWEGPYIIIGVSLVTDPYDTFEDYEARPGDLITDSLKSNASFYVSRVYGKDVFGYYIKEEE